jgi:hypothetical protein
MFGTADHWIRNRQPTVASRVEGLGGSLINAIIPDYKDTTVR